MPTQALKSELLPVAIFFFGLVLCHDHIIVRTVKRFFVIYIYILAKLPLNYV